LSIVCQCVSARLQYMRRVVNSYWGGNFRRWPRDDRGERRRVSLDSKRLSSTATVSAGSGGIGAATCRLLAQSGTKVTVNGRYGVAIDSLVEEIRGSRGEAIGVGADLTDFAAVEQMRQRVGEELGTVEALAAFAGDQGCPTPTEQMAEEKCRSVIDSDPTSTFLTVRSFLPGMIERGRGSIVTMASSARRLPYLASTAYAAAKARG